MENGRTDRQNFSPFYRTLSPVGAAALLLSETSQHQRSMARELLTSWYLLATGLIIIKGNCSCYHVTQFGALLWASGALGMLGWVRYSWREIGLSYRLRTPQQDFVHLEYCKGNCSYLGNILGYLGAKIGAPDPKCVSHSTLGLMRQTFGRNIFN